LYVSKNKKNDIPDICGTTTATTNLWKGGWGWKRRVRKGRMQSIIMHGLGGKPGSPGGGKNKILPRG